MKWFKNGAQLYEAALIYIDKGDNSKALDYLHASSDKKFIEAKCVLAFYEIYGFDGEDWKMFIMLSISDKIAYVADHYLQNGMFEKSLKWYRFAAKKGIKGVWTKMGNAFYEREQLSDAVECYLNGVDEDPFCAYMVGQIADHHPYSVHHITIEKKIDLYYTAASAGIKEAFIPIAKVFEDGVTVDVSIDSAIKWYEKAAEDFVSAQFKLGDLLKDRNPRKSRYWYTKASKAGDEKASMILAKEHIQLGEKERAVDILSPWVDNASSEYLYLYASLVDEEKKLDYLEKASVLGHKEADFDLYLWHYKRENITTAWKYLSSAAEAKSAMALCHLGHWFARERKWTQAFENYSKAAIHADKVALRKVAKCYWLGRGVEKDVNKAILYIKRASSEEDQLSKYILALMYAKGTLVMKSLSQAKVLFSQVEGHYKKYAELQLGIMMWNSKEDGAYEHLSWAFQNGIIRAGWWLAVGHEDAIWVNSNLSSAIYYYQAVVTLFPQAYIRIAMIFQNGRYGVMDRDRAERSYQLAMDHEVKGAHYNYAVFLLEDESEQADRRAVALLEQARVLGDMDSIFLLGSLHLNHQISSADESKGLSLLKEAASHDNTNAIATLDAWYQKK